MEFNISDWPVNELTDEDRRIKEAAAVLNENFIFTLKNRYSIVIVSLRQSYYKQFI